MVASVAVFLFISLTYLGAAAVGQGVLGVPLVVACSLGRESTKCSFGRVLLGVFSWACSSWACSLGRVSLGRVLLGVFLLGVFSWACFSRYSLGCGVTLGVVDPMKKNYEDYVLNCCCNSLK